MWYAEVMWDRPGFPFRPCQSPAVCLRASHCPSLSVGFSNSSQHVNCITMCSCHFKHFLYTVLKSSYRPYDVGIIIIPVLWLE